jgi:UDP-N-acetylmuramoylalanine--D-glutamate ligase
MDGIEVHPLEAGGLAALLACDIVIKSPGISRYRTEVAQLEQAGVTVCGGLGLWLEDIPAERVACITGTKGKSTTTSIAVHLLRGLGYDAELGGNIGSPPWDPTTPRDPQFWVIETSSFQIPDLTRGPAVAAVTSLSPDHLDWHGSVDRYYSDKLSLCTVPGVRHALAAGDDGLLRAELTPRCDHVQWVGADDPGIGGSWVDALQLPGPHNRRNAGMARAVLVALGVPEASDDALLAEAAKGFAGLPSRCQSIGRVGNVEFVDDGLSTNVLSVAAALETFGDRRVALLVGGQDRGVDYIPLGHAVAGRRQPTLVITMPDNGPRIGQAVRGVGRDIEVVDAASLDEAVDTAFTWCGADGVVLLSPAAPSFGHFADYRDRGRAFAAAAARCGRLT